MQRRDRYGRFAEMGGGFSFNFKFPSGSSGPAAGRVVGQSGEDLIEVEMRGVEGVPDGIYSAPSQKGTAVKAVLKIDGSNVRTENIKKTITEEDAIDLSTLKVSAQPSGWTPRETADGEPKEWSSDDGIVVRQFADSYVAYDTDSAGNPANEIARGESWADIQKATENYEKPDTPASAPEPDTAPDLDAPSAAPSPEPTSPSQADRLPNNSVGASETIEISLDTGSTYGPDELAIEVSNINGKKIIFGAPDAADLKIDTSDVELIPLDPYEISGFSSDTEEGREFALKWLNAKVALAQKPDSFTTKADELLYAGARGDESARAEFESLAEEGKKLVEAAEKSFLQAARNMADERLRNIGDIDQILPNGVPRFTESQRQQIRKNLEMSIDDMYVVHQSEYAFPVDEDGNIVLKPASAYPTKMPDGTEVLVPRHTIHTTLNHVADGIPERPWPQNSNVVIIPLRDLLDANPGATDALYTVDTYFTPPPGEALVFPSGSYRTIENITGDESAGKSAVNDLLKEMGAEYVKTSEDTDAVSSAFNHAVINAGTEIGAQYEQHSSMHHATLDKVFLNNYISIGDYTKPGFIAQLSRNARLRYSTGKRGILHNGVRVAKIRESKEVSVT